MSTTDLALHRNGTELDVQMVGRVMAESGYFKDAREMAQATVKVLAGREMGIGPVAAMMGIYFFEGKVTISAGLMAAAVRSSAKYDYRLGKHDETVCEIEFFQGSESLGVERFTIEQARTAGLAGKPVWKSYPKNMLFARAMSNGVRWFCPDVFAVGSVYTPEEMGADVDRDGNALNVPRVVSVEPLPETTNGHAVDAEPIAAKPETPRERLKRLGDEANLKLTEEERNAVKEKAAALGVPVEPDQRRDDRARLVWCELIQEALAAKAAADADADSEAF